jgi:hypothetical protein
VEKLRRRPARNYVLPRGAKAFFDYTDFIGVVTRLMSEMRVNLNE